MIVVGLLLSVVLPLLAGLPWILMMDRDRTAGAWPIALAYGYVLGMRVGVAGLRLLDLVNGPANILTVAALPLIVAIAGWRKNPRYLRSASDALRASAATWRSMSRGTRWVTTIVIALIALRLLTLGSEILIRPIFPWEAVSGVAAKARVWFELGNLAPFVSPQRVLEGVGTYTDADSGAFALPSLLMVFTAHMLTQWHEGAVGFPWLMLSLVVALAIYGHLRRTGAGVAFAVTFAYVFVSLPLVNLHIGLAGAPLWIAAAGVGLAGCAMLRWLETRTRDYLWLIAIGLVLALASLAATWPWLVVFAAAAAIRQWPKHARRISIGLPILVLFALLAWQQSPITVGTAKLQLQVVPTWTETLESMFLLDNWHLLYGGALLVAIGGWRIIVSDRWLPRTWVVAMGLGVLFVWGAVSVPGVWFGGLRDFSYAALQFAPILVMWTALVARAIAIGETQVSNDVVAEPAGPATVAAPIEAQTNADSSPAPGSQS